MDGSDAVANFATGLVTQLHVAWSLGVSLVSFLNLLCRPALCHKIYQRRTFSVAPAVYPASAVQRTRLALRSQTLSTGCICESYPNSISRFSDSGVLLASFLSLTQKYFTIRPLETGSPCNSLSAAHPVTNWHSTWQGPAMRH